MRLCKIIEGSKIITVLKATTQKNPGFIQGNLFKEIYFAQGRIQKFQKEGAEEISVKLNRSLQWTCS